MNMNYPHIQDILGSQDIMLIPLETLLSEST